MTDKKIDRRISRTKRLIRNALTELLETKGFEEITVKDITEQADINRGTFYLHYDSKYDLLEQSEDEILEEMNQYLKKINPNLIIYSQSQKEPIPFLISFFEIIQKNSHFMRLILGPNGNPIFQIKLKNFIKDNFLNNLLSQVTNLNSDNLSIPTEYLVTYVSSAHLGVIQHWLEGGMKQSPREIALVLSNITFHGPAHIAGIKRD